MAAQHKIPDLFSGEAIGASDDLATIAPPPFPVSAINPELEVPPHPQASPAHQLQQELRDAFETEDEKRLPLRQSLALVIYVCGAFWGLVIWGLTQAFA